MKKVLIIILGIVVSIVIIVFSINKLYIEPTLDNIPKDSAQIEKKLIEEGKKSDKEYYKETVKISMDDLLNQMEENIYNVQNKYENKIIIVTADLNKSKEIHKYEEYGKNNKPILKTDLIDYAIFYSNNKKYKVYVDFIVSNVDFNYEDHFEQKRESFYDDKIKQKYKVENLKEKENITFKCLGVSINDDGNEDTISLEVEKLIEE